MRMRPGKGRAQRRLSVLAQGSGKRAEVAGGTRPRGLPFSKWSRLSSQRRSRRRHQTPDRAPPDEKPSKGGSGSGCGSGRSSTRRRAQRPACLARRCQHFGSRNRRTISTEFGIVLGMTARPARCARCRGCGQTMTGQGRAHDTGHADAEQGGVVSRMKMATQPDAIRCQVVRSCGSTGVKGREGTGLVGWVLAVMIWYYYYY